MSRGLGQGELLEGGPSRRLIVAPGDSAWWGVDPSTLRVSVASVSSEGVRGVSTVSFPSLKGVGRLGRVYSLTRGSARELAEVVRPGVIVVEQPSGKVQNLQLTYAVGVIMAALAGAAPWAQLVTVNSMTWKSVACGHGHIYKPKKERGSAAPVPEAYGVLPWARSMGYVGSSWDEADAWGIADYARRMFLLEER